MSNTILCAEHNIKLSASDRFAVRVLLAYINAASEFLPADHPSITEARNKLRDVRAWQRHNLPK